MAAKQQILHLLVATVAVLLIETAVADENRAEHDGSENGERRFPFSFLSFFRESHLSPSGPNSNDTDGERKFHWPSSATITIHRTGQLDSGAAQQAPGEPNTPGAAPGNDTDGQRKWHFSVTAHHRAGQALHHEGDPQVPEGFKLDQEERSYGFLPALVSCNHTTQAGRTCADCSHSLLCLPNNLGIKRNCGPRYCDGGRCSPQPSANCTDTSNA